MEEKSRGRSTDAGIVVTQTSTDRDIVAALHTHAAEIAGFAKIVMGQDGDASEMNQRGLRSPAYDGGRLMPEEYEILRFHDWLRQEMGP